MRPLELQDREVVRVESARGPGGYPGKLRSTAPGFTHEFGEQGTRVHTRQPSDFSACFRSEAFHMKRKIGFRQVVFKGYAVKGGSAICRKKEYGGEDGLESFQEEGDIFAPQKLCTDAPRT